MKVRYLLHKKGLQGSLRVAPDQPLTEAIHLMMQHRVGSLVVIDGEQLAGIVTERDVMRAVDEHLDNFRDVLVQDVMTPDPVVCGPDASVDDAMDTMLHNATGDRIRHLPVVDGSQLVGIISIADIIDGLLTETRFENRLLKHYIRNWPEPEE